jgi:hypothetical protein
MKILVYTMGKVGSTTVIRALQSAGIAAGRAYPGNIGTLNLDEYDGFITMVRDPVARNISQFFETQQYVVMNSINPLAAFVDTFNHLEPLRWFDDHIKPILDINVMRKSFHKTRAWEAYGNLLVIKTEWLSIALADALTEFCGPANYTVEHRAIGVEKFGPVLGEKYQQFLETAKFSEDFLNRLYDTKFMKKFYLKSEIESFYARWME